MHLVGTHEGSIIFKDSVSTKDIQSVIQYTQWRSNLRFQLNGCHHLGNLAQG